MRRRRRLLMLFSHSFFFQFYTSLKISHYMQELTMLKMHVCEPVCAWACYECKCMNVEYGSPSVDAAIKWANGEITKETVWVASGKRGGEEWKHGKYMEANSCCDYITLREIKVVPNRNRTMYLQHRIVKIK